MSGQGVRVNLVATSEDLPTFNVGDEVFQRNIKVNNSGEQLYADLDDTTEVEVLEQSLGFYPVGLTGTITWHQR